MMERRMLIRIVAECCPGEVMGVLICSLIWFSVAFWEIAGNSIAKHVVLCIRDFAKARLK